MAREETQFPHASMLTLRYPVFNKYVAQCRRNPTQEEYDNLLDTFEYFLRAAIDHGHIDEELYDLYGVVRDRDMNGNEVFRNAGISQESYQRAKCLTHKYQVHLRKQQILQLQKKERQKEELANAKWQAKIDNNIDVVHLLCSKLERDGKLFEAEKDSPKEEYLSRCTLDMIAELNGDQLGYFILARLDGEKYKFTSLSSLPKKGTLEEAQDENAWTKIRIAYNCLENPNCVEGKLPFDLTVVEDETSEEDFTPTVISLSDDDDVLPSQLLSSEQWVKYVIELFNLEDMGIAEVTKEEMDKADLLVKLLRERYYPHIKGRIKNKAKHTHWSMKLAYKNLPVDAALQVLSRHTKRDLLSLKEYDSLLASNTNSFYQVSRFPSKEGAYLYYDDNLGDFVRSGKKTRGGGFAARGKEHKDGAKAAKSSSNFYFKYPSETSARKSQSNKQGLFENLSFVVAAGFWSEEWCREELG